MSTPYPLYVQTVVIAPIGWALVDERDRIRIGDYMAGSDNKWKRADLLVGRHAGDVGTRAVIRKEKLP